MITDSKIIAHRGVFDNVTVVENTLESFKKAIELNIPFELDVQLTADNEIVVFHDEKLSRLHGDDTVIQKSPYNQLRRYHLLNTTSHIPLLDEVLKLNNDRVLIDVEIKRTKRIKETVNILMKELKRYKKYIIKSFDIRIVRYVKKHFPNVTCGLLVKSNYKNPIYQIIAKSSFAIKYTMCDFVSISKTLLNDERYCEIVKDIPKLVWTINKKEEITNIGEDYIYICNNLPYNNLIDGRKLKQKIVNNKK